MDKETLERIRKMTKDKITVSNFQNSDFMEEYEKKKIINMKKIVVACLVLILGTSIIFQNDIKAFVKYHFGPNKLIDTVVENGYIEEVDMNSIDSQTTLNHEESGTIIDDVDASIKIDEFLMDDITLSTNFSFKFDDKIKEFLDLDNLQFVSLQDLIVFDEENRIVLSNCDKETFERICKQYNLDYSFEEDYLNLNTSYDSFLNDRIKEENLVKYCFCFHAENTCFPNSKELNFVFSKIKLEKYEDYTGQDIEKGEYLKSNSVILTGDWKINVKVPETMYNRPKSEYKVVSISNPNIMVSCAIASETGFRFNAIISKVEESKTNKFDAEMITTGYWYFADDEEKSIDKITHITNSKGKKFQAPTSTTAPIYPENDKYTFTGTFEMALKDATDKLIVTLIYYGEPVEIELEKIK